MKTEDFVQILIDAHTNNSSTIEHVKTTVSAITGILQSMINNSTNPDEKAKYAMSIHNLNKEYEKRYSECV